MPLIEAVDLLVEPLHLAHQRRQRAACDLWQAGVGRVRNHGYQLRDMPLALRRHHAELGQMAAQRVDQRRALADQ